MFDWLKEQQNVTFLIAVAGFFMSAASWIKEYLSQRKKISCRVSQWGKGDDLLYMFLHIENESRLPIAVTNIKLCSENATFSCVPFPEKVYEERYRTGDRITSETTYFSERIPISICSLGAMSGFVLFRGCLQDFPVSSTHVSLEFSTNRGMVRKKQLELPAVNQQNTL